MTPEPPTDLTLYRIDQLEAAVETMAGAAEKQAEFNAEVATFMSSAKTWGKVGLLLYGTGQSAILVVLAWGISKL